MGNDKSRERGKYPRGFLSGLQSGHPFLRLIFLKRFCCFVYLTGETHMKGFHRTKLIPSLAASAMLAVTLAPLPSFLAPANVYAATPPNNVHITGPALLNKSTGKVSVLIK